jgi:ATP/maltotriose-dependent transcriptional regulator MalT
VAFALMGLGWARSRQGAYSAAAALLEEAIALFRDVGMKQLFAFASSLLAEVACARGEAGQATALLEDSVTLFRDIGDTYGLAMALRILGTVVHAQGDDTHATTLHEESSPCVEPSGTSTASRSAWKAWQMSP